MKKLILALFVLFISCKKIDDDVVAIDDTSLRKEIIVNYADIVYNNYLDSYDKAVLLKTSLNSFVNSPSQSTFDSAKSAYINARAPFLQTEAYRFYGGPIDADDSSPEGRLNSWPLDEAYIDYVDGNLTSGIINNLTDFPTISTTLIDTLNGKVNEESISCGFHAIEFLLWGQDFNATGPGQRPYTDYVTGGTNSNQIRRGQYLLACVDLLVQDLEILVNAWKPNSNNYRKSFLEAPVNESLSKIMTGLGKLSKGELAGERMTVALTEQNQEQEHSCFADQTHIDIQLDQLGMYNVYIGKYVKVNGTTIQGKSLSDLVRSKDATLNSAMLSAFVNSTNATLAIPIPFDNAIFSTEGRIKIQDCVTKLRSQGDKLVECANKIGIQIVL